jgi:dethiobiotin synthase
MIKGIFVTGTDTGIGKTLVTAGIVRWLRAHWIDTVPMKPVQTGAERRGDMLAAPDLDFCLAAAGIQPNADERRLMAPYVYEPACSPHLAGRMAGRYPDIAAIRKNAEILLRRRQALVIEGAGGIMVPLNETETTLDLMKSLGFPVVLVSRIGLGAINHALLSINSLNAAGLPLLGVIFNQAEPPLPGNRYIEEDNPKAVAEFGKVKILGNVGYLEKTLTPTEMWQRFIQAVPGLEEIGKAMEMGPWQKH